MHIIKWRKGNRIFHILRRNFLKHVTERKREEAIRRGIRPEGLLNVVQENTRYWTMKEEALYRTMRRTRSERVFGSVARQTVP